MKLLLLDLDDTVHEPKSGAKFISQPDDQQLIQGVEDAIARYHNWAIVGVTNQGGVAAGHKSLEDAIAEQSFTLKLVPQLEVIYFCPDFDGTDCWQVNRYGAEKVSHKWASIRDLQGQFRKPNPGMLLIPHAPEIEEELYVGDREEDEQAATAANIPFMWAETWRTNRVPF